MYYRGDNDWHDFQAMQHWKYIKKKKVNGKWRYYYDIKDALGYDEREARDKAATNYSKATKDAYDFQDHVSTQNTNAIIGHDPYTGAPVYTKGGKERIQDLEKQKQEKFKKAADAGKAASDAQKEFAKTPLGKLENLESKVKKAKKWLKGIFNID